MIKIYKQGITRIIPEKELQKYENFGYKQVKETHKPEPMVIEKETKTKEK